jgi:predicted Zn-dependent protease
LSGDFSRAATLYGTLLVQRPDDPRLLLSYAEALLGAGRYKDARAQFDHLRPMHAVGPRDLGVPAATACILDGDPDAGIEWLKTIPKQFLPRGLLDDMTFRSVRERADFQALFH